MNPSTSGIKVKDWTPAVPCKVPDNIVSSQYTSKKVFIPSYEKVDEYLCCPLYVLKPVRKLYVPEEKRPCMEQLLANEYQRMWWQEKEDWDKRSSTKIGPTKLLHRMRVKKKAAVLTKKEVKIKRPELKKVSRGTDTTMKEKGTSIDGKVIEKAERKDAGSKARKKEESKVKEASKATKREEKSKEAARNECAEDKENKADKVIEGKC